MAIVVIKSLDLKERYPDWLPKAQEELRTRGGVEIVIRDVSAKEGLRSAMYQYFGGRRLQIQYVGEVVNERSNGRFSERLSMTAIVIVGEKIRTNTLHYGPAYVEGSSRPHRNPERKMCPVCLEVKPLSEFSPRVAYATADRLIKEGKEIPRYSYCKECFKSYMRWRRMFLKAHEAKRLKTEFSRGYGPNPYFKEYLEGIIQGKLES